MLSKVKSNVEVMSHIPDQAHIATVSFGVGGTPEYLLKGLHDHYLAHQRPKNITFSTTAGIGTIPGQTGADLLLQEGFLKRFIGSHIMSSPNTAQAILDNQIEGYLLPQGTIGMIYQDAARQGSGILTQVGLNTYADPDQLGGAMNERSQESLVDKICLNGQDWLYYKPWKIDVAIIKATYADEKGNLSFRHETNDLEVYALAAAAHHHDGIVIAQVEEVVKSGSLPAREVEIPGALVDYIVIADPEYHRQTFGHQYHPALSQEIRVPYQKQDKFEYSPAKAVARRAAKEIEDGMIVNIGYGLASEVAKIFAEEERIDNIHLTTDLGAFGGLPASGHDYGPNYNADAVLNTLDMFALYQGGGLDACILGFGQFDEKGNMNTTVLSNRLIGPGGMVDIAHGSDHIIFIGTFSVKADLTIQNGQLIINKEGKLVKFAKEIEHITFNAEEAIAKGKKITIITERAVFQVSENNQLCLTEYAPGIDIEKDIIDLMPFDIEVSENLKEMSKNLWAQDN